MSCRNPYLRKGYRRYFLKSVRGSRVTLVIIDYNFWSWDMNLSCQKLLNLCDANKKDGTPRTCRAQVTTKSKAFSRLLHHGCCPYGKSFTEKRVFKVCHFSWFLLLRNLLREIFFLLNFCTAICLESSPQRALCCHMTKRSGLSFAGVLSHETTPPLMHFSGCEEEEEGGRFLKQRRLVLGVNWRNEYNYRNWCDTKNGTGPPAFRLPRL